jgi:hypothetical protein
MLPLQMRRFRQELPGVLRFQSQRFRGANAKHLMQEWSQSLPHEPLLKQLPLMFLALIEELS